MMSCCHSNGQAGKESVPTQPLAPPLASISPNVPGQGEDPSEGLSWRGQCPAPRGSVWHGVGVGRSLAGAWAGPSPELAIKKSSPVCSSLESEQRTAQRNQGRKWHLLGSSQWAQARGSPSPVPAPCPCRAEGPREAAGRGRAPGWQHQTSPRAIPAGILLPPPPLGWARPGLVPSRSLLGRRASSWHGGVGATMPGASRQLAPPRARRRGGP